ncbi:MAG: hypothetical protein NTY37_09405 [Methanothrix sp.]|nr:hypothetical protein [Methanothrix sp.]
MIEIIEWRYFLLCLCISSGCTPDRARSRARGDRPWAASRPGGPKSVGGSRSPCYKAAVILGRSDLYCLYVIAIVNYGD